MTTKYQISKTPDSSIFKAVKEAYEQNLGVEYYDPRGMSDKDFLIDEVEEDKKYRVFTKGFCLSVESEIVIDDIENEKGEWHKEYEISEESKSYGMTPVGVEKIIKFINDKIISFIP